MLVKSYVPKKPYNAYVGYWDDERVETTRECLVEDKDYFSGLYNSEGEPLYKQKPKLGYI